MVRVFYLLYGALSLSFIVKFEIIRLLVVLVTLGVKLLSVKLDKSTDLFEGSSDMC